MIPYYAMEQQFYSEFPQLVKEACANNPALVSQAQQARYPNRFEKAILAVVKDQYATCEERLAFAKQRYRRKLRQVNEKHRDVGRVKPADKFESDRVYFYA